MRSTSRPIEQLRDARRTGTPAVARPPTSASGMSLPMRSSTIFGSVMVSALNTRPGRQRERHEQHDHGMISCGGRADVLRGQRGSLALRRSSGVDHR